MGNMELWDKVSKTDPKYTKEFKGKGGYSGTAINATYQAKQMTKQFGTYGIGWGLENTKYTIEKMSDDFHDSLLVFKADLFYYHDGKKGIIPIDSDLDIWVYSRTYKSWSKNNDMHKKVKTDAMTKGFSLLGLSADVFLGLYDDNKYLNEVRHEFAEKPKPDYRQEIFNLMESGKIPQADKDNYIKSFKANSSLLNAKTVNELKAKYFNA